MKGPSLQYDLRVLRIFHCDGCGREAQVPAGVTSHTCACTDPPKFMRPLERVRVTSPDVTAFLSVPDPSELVEETVEVEEPYVPYIPPMPPKRVQFPNRRRLSDDIDKFQPAEFGDGVDSQGNMASDNEGSGGDASVTQPHRNDPRERPQRPRKTPRDDRGATPPAEQARRTESTETQRNDQRPEHRSGSPERPERTQGQQRSENFSRPRSQEQSAGSSPRGERPADGGRSNPRSGGTPSEVTPSVEGGQSPQSGRRSRNRRGQRAGGSEVEVQSGGPGAEELMPASPNATSPNDDFGSGIVSERPRNQSRPERSENDSDSDDGPDDLEGVNEPATSEGGPRRKNRRRGRRRGRGPGPAGSPPPSGSDS